jgi:membrane-bound serine protease (ClpP class)
MGTVALIVILLVAAMFLIAAEIYTPVFGILIAAAIACCVGAVITAWTIDDVVGLLVLLCVLVGMPVYTVFAVKILPKTALGRRIHLTRSDVDPGEGTPESDNLQKLIGQTTIADTVLRPSGVIRIDGRRIVAQAESGMIERGEEVTVIRSAGNRLIVRPTGPSA